MTLVHLLPDTATISLTTAAKSLEMDPGELLLLLWYRGCKIIVELEGKDRTVFMEVRETDKWSSWPGWLSHYSVRTLASVGVIDAWMEPGMDMGEAYDGERCSVTLDCVSVRSGDAAKAALEPLAPANQEQKDLSPKREKTLLKFIGALLAMRYTGQAYENSNGGVNVSRMAERVQQDMAKANINDDGLKDRTLRDLIPLAMEAINENMAPEKGGDG